jgi:hypothetical protein
MPLVGHGQVAERRLFSRRGVVVLLAILALTVSLANRVPHTGSFDKTPAAHSSSSTAKIQHRDQDASRWVAPAPTFALLWTSEPSVPLDGDRKVSVRLQDNSLHNRPPPLS